MKSTCPPPPVVYNFGDLVEFKKRYGDTIFVSIDIENVDHQPKDHRPFFMPLEKLSEMGLAVYDPRGPPSTNEIQEIQGIQVKHHVIDEWAWVTSKTCPNRSKAWHRGAHKASPYTASFCFSKVSSCKDVMSELSVFLQALQTQNLTPEEVANGVRREVILLSWDSNAESKLFDDYAYDFIGRNNVKHWDLQLWLPVLTRFGHGNKTGAEKFYETTGVLGSGENLVTLHNASNDAWAQIATLRRFFNISEDCFTRWIRAEHDMEPLDMGWVNPDIPLYNAALEEEYKPPSYQQGLSGVSLEMRPAHHVKTENGHLRSNPNPPPALNDTSAFPDLASAPKATAGKAPSMTVWGSRSSAHHLFKTKVNGGAVEKGSSVVGTESPDQPKTKQGPTGCWARPLSFTAAAKTTTAPSSSATQSTSSVSSPTTSLSTVTSASTARTPSPPTQITPIIKSNTPAGRSGSNVAPAASVHNGSENNNSPQYHDESSSAGNYGNGAAGPGPGPANENGHGSSKNSQPKKNKRGRKRRPQVVWEL